MTANRRKPKPVLVLIAAAMAWGALWAGPGWGCDVPVFRYALERWAPSLYDVVVLHGGEMSAEQTKLAKDLADRAGNQDAPCNMDVRQVDVTKAAPEDLEPLRRAQAGLAMPRVAVCYPRRSYGPPVVAWAGPLTAENVQAIVDSPARLQVVKGMSAGDSAVWVLLEGGQKAKDDAAAELLATELKRLQGELKLPEPMEDPFGPADPADKRPPLKLAFSLVRLSRKAAGEAVFVEMLQHTEEDLAKEFAAEPMAFAVFGQGRAMFALVGKGINKQNVEDLSAFLAGRCGCEIKDRNPGTDLLLTADWYEVLRNQPIASPQTVALPAAIAAPATGPAEADGEGPLVAPAPAGPRSAAEAGPGGMSPIVRNVLIALGAMALAAGALVFYLGRRAARN